jgi:menaquinone-specific isochorismate synthase
VTRLVARTIAIEESTDLLRRFPDGDGLVWLRAGNGLVGCGEAARLDPGAGHARFDRANDQLSEVFERTDVTDEVNLPGTGPVAFGSFTFDPAAPDSVVVVPSMIVGRREDTTWLTHIGAEPSDHSFWSEPGDSSGSGRPAGGARDRVRYAGSTVSETAWLDAVAEAEAVVRRGGAVEKVVLARDLLVWSKTAFDKRLVLERLARRFPECYTFCLDGLVGATPELLVRTMGDVVESVVLAGSAPRGSRDDEDRRLGEELLASDKDRREHEVGVRSVRDILSQACSTLEAPAGPHLLRLANVQHLSTSFRGRLAEPLTSLEMAGRLHPTAAVCGLPRPDALELIRDLEGMDRARYGGPVGWMDARGDGEWGIALRCAEIKGRRGRLFAGCGIVEGSVPEAELEETRLKLRAMQSALTPT